MSVIKKKACVVCGVVYQPTGMCAKYCSDECLQTVKKQQCWDAYCRWKAKKGGKPGVGTGNAQGFGKEHHSFKPDAAHRYRDYLKQSCERCGSTKFLCGHHKDHNHDNNDPENIETLCKRCHQIEHNCVENLKAEPDDKRKRRLAERQVLLNKTLPRINGRNASLKDERMKSIYTTRMFTSWSWSRLHDWEHCAYFAKLKHLDKLPLPGSPAMDRGSLIGKMCEDFVKGTIKRLPQELKLFEEEFYELRKAYKTEGDKSIFVEQMWGFDKDWKPVAWDDWANCVLRVKMDLARMIAPDHLLDIDYKTGKLREENVHEYENQLHLYGTATFFKFPHVMKVSSALAYLDLGVTYPTEGPTVYERPQAVTMRKEWDARVKPMLNDTRFEPRPNDKCRWCHFRQSNGGPCRF